MRVLEKDEASITDREPGSTDWYAATIEATLEGFGTDGERGLSSTEADARRSRHGPNRLEELPPTPIWEKFSRQFMEPVILLLVVASVIAGAMGEWVDTLAILAIVLLNGLLGFFQEERAGRALAALQRISSPMARVIREGVHESVPASDLVPGDRIELEAGDHIPADLRLIQASGFRVQEAALTGESSPVGKDPICVLPRGTPLGDRKNLAYAGTVAVAGKAAALVVATGMATELGRIAGLLDRTESEPTPLQRRLGELGKVLVVVCLAVVGVVFLLQLLRGDDLFDAFFLSVSLAVAAVPEGLPAVVTLTLAMGLQRMVKRNALIRRLPSVETLGSVTVICSDKTGTLTRNEMTVREVVVGHWRYLITGDGYNPTGEFLRADADRSSREGATESAPSRSSERPANPRRIETAADPDLIRLLTIGARCNNARLVLQGDGEESWQVIGDPTEGSLLVAAFKAGIEPSGPDQHVVYELPFDSERKAMSVVIRGPDAEVEMNTKGAPEVILDRCVSERRGEEVVPLDDDRRREIKEIGAEMASRALRVLALASRSLPDDGRILEEEKGLTFAGLVGMIDPPREEARVAVARCREAGIRPVVITGDHPETAMAIARDLGIAGEGDRVVSGAELDAISDVELSAEVVRIPVYARVTAEHKLRVVRAWKARGEVVAMTGDGVNDAPAVRAADIGIAMGMTGTDVTKEAAALVLTDDNFASIVNAVEEGRGIFDNIQKFVHYLLSSNAGEVLLMLFAALVGWPAPLTAIQLLWINLVTDGLPALALAMEPPEPEVMQRRPRPPREPVITKRRGMLMLGHGLLIATAGVTAFALASRGGTIEHARAVTFTTLAFAQLFYAFACRSQRHTVIELGLFSNPYLLGAIVISSLLQLSVVSLSFTRSVFDVSTNPFREWGMILTLALAPVTIIEITKYLRSLSFETRRRTPGELRID
ncbi:cation-translocating P-type ATPase [Tundrisphaera lichenicola]|uniref:cation-translocating P-type ATPase n=1 Tax=Tundrisphaera lichenicola TaxID=2029860 RepID=UPI003EBB6037